MRLTNVRGRLTVDVDGNPHDVERVSRGVFSSDPQAVYDRWDEFWDRIPEMVAAADEPTSGPLAGALGPVVPFPRQVFAIGLNYVNHAAETGFELPADPVVFTKFSSCLAGPFGVVVLPEGEVDWEVELVVVISREASAVTAEHAWEYVAGVTVGQDLSERVAQMQGSAPQFSLAKSHPGFGPIGPALVTPDALANPDDLELGCSVNGLEVQRARTSDMIFGVPELISRLSRTVTLLPGDLLFTGTPPGVGMGRTPRRFLRPGDQLKSFVDGVGAMRQTFVTGLPETASSSPATSGVVGTDKLHSTWGR
ncbi:fumarylacetoacetate hydrolase family protein [Pseudonocardia kujensis]|uniref:fumarylacetoacetate hydrolase family protein n=1 Tax=Pseudonocardia kujensis TaxID=1128675 RepID=UPI001E3E229E|nr:fumarylacetoacetate hydrolase family protein [Pseudonocardia kujensis]MCE0767385.1 fumarylacetoacetate hydrolase family protein [Pseudonocardia kujensis]